MILNNLKFCDNTILLIIAILSAIVAPFYTLVENVGAKNDGNDDPNPGQLGDLRTCTIQEENIQGQTIIGTILADVCRGTDRGETILGLQDNDVLSGEAGDDIVIGGKGDDKIFGNAGDDFKEIWKTTRLMGEAAMMF